MRLSYRLSLSLIAGVALTSLAFALYQTVVETRNLRTETERHAVLLAESIQKQASPLAASGNTSELQSLMDRFRVNEGLLGIAVYDAGGTPVAATSTLNPLLGRTPHSILDTAADGRARGEFRRAGNQAVHVYAVPLQPGAGASGALAVFHDVSYIDAQAAAVWWRALLHVAIQTFLIVGVTLAIIHLSLRKPMQNLTQWLRDMRTGKATTAPQLPGEDVFGPITTEVERLAVSLNAARAAAEEEARLRDAAESLWTLERLRVHVQGRLNGSRLFVISNREPYEHFFRGDSIEYKVPASGLVTALEPVLSACGGTWIAQATGDADRASVDQHNRVAVPPDHPHYTLRRLWMTKEQEQGFYFGFANEGLWPLCHIAHTRPTFRAEDWEHYREVNRLFADAFLQEAAGDPSPIVLVQDYHFALLPRMIKERMPEARVAIFWHIPWPNPEAFGICPWQHELIDGILGADLVGFHIQQHCNNFLDTVDRTVECRIERERYGVNRLGHFTSVRPFPISVGSTPPASASDFGYDARAKLLRGLSVEASVFGVGVDRIDYTKGIPERFRGIERFLDLYPAYRKQFTFVQIGAPSRTHIRRYQDLVDEVESEAERINRKFQANGWKPIVLVKRQHSHAEILPFFRAASLCLVTSLHDGMNLVAKEFVASREDDGGALILSRFAGASHELTDAITVNPYDTDQIAGAIRHALEMAPEERLSRMRRMRAVVREHNIYRWAGNLVSELSEIRLPEAAAPAPPSPTAMPPKEPEAVPVLAANI